MNGTGAKLTGTIVGALLAANLALVLLSGFGIWPALSDLSGGIALVTTVLLLPGTPVSRKVFAALCLAVFAAATLRAPDWSRLTLDALARAGHVAAFFTAISVLRVAALTSPAFRVAGEYLASRSAGNRYLALTLGSHAIALILNYGTILLLSTLVSRPDDRSQRESAMRGHLAIHRGVASTLTWAPVSLSVAISLTLVPGAHWPDILLPGMVSAAIVMGTGFVLDTVTRSRTGDERTQDGPPLSAVLPATVVPLLFALSVLAVVLGAGVGPVVAVVAIAPVFAVLWLRLQKAGDPSGFRTSDRLGQFFFADLPGYNSELVLLTTATFLGVLGSGLALQTQAAAGFSLPFDGRMVLVGSMWLVVAAGILGVNPLLSVSLLAPWIVGAIGAEVSPGAIVTALTAGWMLCAISSPLTATTVLVGRLTGESALRIGFVHNGILTLVAGLLLSVWVTFRA